MKAKTKAAKAKSKRPKMPKFFVIDDEMKELSAMLEQEVSDWPGISKKPMFGYQGLYRGGKIFAALPRSRAMRSPRSIMLKLASASPTILESAKKDSRVSSVSGMTGAGWVFFELEEASATKEALGWLNRAYEAAKK
ncbi:MAG TPA: hypothetical protein VMR90_15460 [Candidatus Cybelea sp.]|jgi:hypothetical protein|nr:hypothetical protein [Candidatus Cybelea sp.]